MTTQTCGHCGMANKVCDEKGKCPACQELKDLDEVMIDTLSKRYWEQVSKIEQLELWNANQMQAITRLRAYLLEIAKLVDHEQTGLDPNNFDGLVTQLEVILSDAKQ